MRLTQPGITDLHWMSVVCTADLSLVDFHETEDEAMAVARASLVPGVSSYVSRVSWQGEATGAKRGRLVPVVLSSDDVTALKEAPRGELSPQAYAMKMFRELIAGFRVTAGRRRAG